MWADILIYSGLVIGGVTIGMAFMAILQANGADPCEELECIFDTERIDFLHVKRLYPEYDEVDDLWYVGNDMLVTLGQGSSLREAIDNARRNYPHG